jgi:hypothetical protein
MKIGIIVFNNLIKGNGLSDQFEHILHRNSGPGHTWLPKMDIGVDGYSAVHGSFPFLRDHKRNAFARYGSAARFRASRLLYFMVAAISYGFNRRFPARDMLFTHVVEPDMPVESVSTGWTNRGRSRGLRTQTHDL